MTKDAKNEGRQLSSPTMTRDYSRVSDTARAVVSSVTPLVEAYIDSIADRISRMDEATPFIIADYGSADGVNSGDLLETAIRRVRAINRAASIRLLYVDLAERAPFDRFWKNSRLSLFDRVEARYVRQSFYDPLPEAEGMLQLGFSSTAIHWLNTKSAEPGLFKHREHIQANQLPAEERSKFARKWGEDWTAFLKERSRELVQNGALFLAGLADLGGDEWPASAGYNYLRDVCRELHQEGRISDDDRDSFFIPDYFATPREVKSLCNDGDLKRLFFISSCEAVTVPCAYFSPAKGNLMDPQARADLADTLSRVVRAWSESSVMSGLSPRGRGMIDEIYRRLREKFLQNPKALPYQYCLVELIKR